MSITNSNGCGSYMNSNLFMFFFFLIYGSNDGSDFRSTSSSDERIPAELSAKNPVGTVLFCFVFFPGLWPPASDVRGVAETYHKKQVGSAFYHPPCDWKGACDECEMQRLATMYGAVESDILCATADTSGGIVWLTGKNELFISLMRCSRSCCLAELPVLFLKKKKGQKSRDTAGGETSIRAH